VQIHAQYKLEGRVVDHTSQQAIPLARIYLLETVQLTLSDSTGYFQFIGIVPQKITLLVEAKGYESKNLVVSEKLIISIKVELNLAHINDVDEVTVDAKSIEISNRHMFSVDYQKLSSIEFTQASFFQQNQVAAYENPSRFYQLCHSSVHVTHTGIHLVEIELSAKNITNSNYIDHLSRLKNIGMPSQGRSFILSVKWKITT